MRTLVRAAFLVALCLASWVLWLAIVALASFVAHEAGWPMLLASVALMVVLVVFITLASSDEPQPPDWRPPQAVTGGASTSLQMLDPADLSTVLFDLTGPATAAYGSAKTDFGGPFARILPLSSSSSRRQKALAKPRRMSQPHGPEDAA